MTPTAVNGGLFNRGTVTLNGATPVAPGAAPTFVVTAGTKVAVTGTASDTSIYSIEIG